MHKPEHCCEGGWLQATCSSLRDGSFRGWWVKAPRGALPGSVTAAPLAKVTEAKMGWLLNRSIYRIITVIITLLSVISTDFNLSKLTSTQSLCLTLPWRGNLWQRVVRDLLSVLSMNSSSCPGATVCMTLPWKLLSSFTAPFPPVVCGGHEEGVRVLLTRVPEELHTDAHSPPLASRNTAEVLIPYPGVCTLTQA